MDSDPPFGIDFLTILFQLVMRLCASLFMPSKIIYSLILLLAALLIWLNAMALYDYFFPASSPEIRVLVGQFFQSLVVLSSAILLYQLVNYFLWKKVFEEKLKTQAPKILKDITLVLILIIASAIIAGAVFDQPLTGFWATSGVTALVIGFALRNMILDLFSGIALNIEKPYSIGDWIEIHHKLSDEKTLGEVMEISWRATQIRTEENTLLIIPNSIISSMAFITNFSTSEAATRFELSYTLDFSVQPDKAKRVILAGAAEATGRSGFVNEKFPQILIEGTNELGVTYKVRFWITPWKGISPSQAKDEVNSRVLKHIWHAGITLAYPKEDVFFERMPRRHLDEDLTADRVVLISKIDLFSVLSSEQKEIISASMVRKNFKRGNMIVNTGEKGDSMFILIEGLLDVFVSDHKQELVKVSQITPGQHFGEMSLLTGELRSASIKAVVDSFVYEITKECFNEVLATREEIIEVISGKIAERKLMNDRVLNSMNDHELLLNGNSYKTSLTGKIRRFFGLSLN